MGTTKPLTTEEKVLHFIRLGACPLKRFRTALEVNAVVNLSRKGLVRWSRETNLYSITQKGDLALSAADRHVVPLF